MFRPQVLLPTDYPTMMYSTSYEQMDVESPVHSSPFRSLTASPFSPPYAFIQESPQQDSATIAQLAENYVAPIKRPLKQFTRKRKSASPSAPSAKKHWHRPDPVAETDESTRFCKACGITTTPQWRRGPDGERSLCNACGLHFYKIVQREKQVADERKREVGAPLPIDMLLNDPDY